MRLPSALKRAASYVDGRDLLALVGLSALGWGLWQTWPPLAAITTGVILLYVALFWSRP